MTQANYQTQLSQLLDEYQQIAQLQPQQLLVIGCSTSEVTGKRIGSASSLDAAKQLLPALLDFSRESQVWVAIQCCEHLNRCLVVEQACALHYRLEAVRVRPHAGAGGALSQIAMEQFAQPVVVESLLSQAHGGVDIGDTLIGMHLRRVAVPVRLSGHVGVAHITAASTRPMLIGGQRARYE